MSCEFKNKENGENFRVKCFDERHVVVIHDEGQEWLQISSRDFADMVVYWLTNTDLVRKDVRVKLCQKIKECNIIKGWNEGKSRLNVGFVKK